MLGGLWADINLLNCALVIELSWSKPWLPLQGGHLFPSLCSPSHVSPGFMSLSSPLYWHLHSSDLSANLFRDTDRKVFCFVGLVFGWFNSLDLHSAQFQYWNKGSKPVPSSFHCKLSLAGLLNNA